MIDFNSKSFGGAERNLNDLALLISKYSKSIVIRRDCVEIYDNGHCTQSYRIRERLRLLTLGYYICKTHTIVAGKSNLILVLLAKILQKRCIIRVNNSFEAYVYWASFKSVVSYLSRIFVDENDLILLNSKKNLDFYEALLSHRLKKPKMMYFPNVSWSIPSTKGKCSSNNIYIIGRLALEKRITELVSQIKGFDLKITFVTDYYVDNDFLKTGVKYVKYNELAKLPVGLVISNSLFEGMPNAIIDALSKGHSVLLANNWAHTELFLDAKEIDNSQRTVNLFNSVSELTKTKICSLLQEIDINKNDELYTKLQEKNLLLRSNCEKDLSEFLL